MFSTERVRRRAGPCFWGESREERSSVVCYVISSMLSGAELGSPEGFGEMQASAAVSTTPPMPVPENA